MHKRRKENADAPEAEVVCTKGIKENWVWYIMDKTMARVFE
jgi:hypothetical protein